MNCLLDDFARWIEAIGSRRRSLIASCAAVMLFTSSTTGQDGADQELPADEAATESIAESDPQPSVETTLNSKSIRFNFRGATYQQVVEFFSRVTGLPVIWQTAPPEGTLDYISPEGSAYDEAEALRVLNMILQSKGVMLRVSRDNLYLQKLDQMQREDIPTFTGEVPPEITADQIVSVVRPLRISLAKPLAEKLANLVASYGAVTAMEQQNTVVITETAANARRILSIIDQLDREDPEGAVEIFAIKNAKASEVFVPLKALMSQKVEKYVVNDKGQQVKIEEDQMPGLSISADDRTNSIIAKGTQSRIDKLREAIELLDVPDVAAGVGRARSMTTIAVSRITPAEAVAKLTQLYQRLEEKARPTVVALDDAAKVMIIGADASITEGSLLIGELENGPVGESHEPMISIVPLERAAPGSVLAAVNSLLNKRQQAAVKVIAGADGKSLIVSGPADDVAAVKSLVPMLDRQAAADRQVRIVRVNSPGNDPASIMEQATRAFTLANPDIAIENFAAAGAEPSASDDELNPAPHAAESLIVDLNSETRVLTMIGTAKSIETFTSALRQIESNVHVEREARRYVLNGTVPSQLIGSLNALAQQLLLPTDGSTYVAPVFAAVDSINTLMVTATPQQLATLEPVIESLDAASSASSGAVHVLTIDNADANQLAMNLEALFSAPGQPQPRPLIRVDGASNSLLVRASEAQLQMISELVSKVDRATIASSRQVRMITIDPSKASADEVAHALRRMLDSSDSGKVQVMSLDDLLKQHERPQPTVIEAAEEIR